VAWYGLGLKAGARGYDAVLLLPCIGWAWERAAGDVAAGVGSPWRLGRTAAAVALGLAAAYLHTGVPYVVLAMVGYLGSDAVARAVRAGSPRPLLLLASVGAWTAGLCAVRLLPTVQALVALPRVWPASADVSLFDLSRMPALLEALALRSGSLRETARVPFHPEEFEFQTAVGPLLGALAALGWWRHSARLDRLSPQLR